MRPAAIASRISRLSGSLLRGRRGVSFYHPREGSASHSQRNTTGGGQSACVPTRRHEYNDPHDGERTNNKKQQKGTSLQLSCCLLLASCQALLPQRSTS